MSGDGISRRLFLASAAAMGGALMSGRTEAATKRPPILIFSKHLQFITDWNELADTYAALGTDGVDLTVRPKGHIEPEHAARDLPACVKAIRGRGLSVPMVTTLLQDGDDPNARVTLEAAAAEGIPVYRCGTARYDGKAPIAAELAAYEKKLRGLAELGEELGIAGAYHNHSGPNYIGAAIWDLHRLLSSIDSPAMGSNYDLGHAIVEGGYGAWRTNLRLIAPYIKAVAAKDFVWTDGERPQWGPLGSGRVPMVDMLRALRELGFSGPISIHFEYKTGSQEEALTEMKTAVTTLRGMMTEAGYA